MKKIISFITINILFTTMVINAQTVAKFTIQPSTASCGVIMQFDAASSSASSGQTITKYEWDFDYDGITFDVDTTGIIIQHSYSKMKTTGSGENMIVIPYTVALRVTNDSSPADIDIATGDATLSFTNNAPLANAGGPYYSTRINDNQIPVTLIGTKSVDPDEPCDEIVIYKWDTDGDGSFGSDDTDGGLCNGNECEGDTVTIVDNSWMTGVTKFIELRVVDSYGLISNAASAQINIVDEDHMPPNIHYITINNFVKGNAFFKFGISQPTINSQVFDCEFLLNGQPITVYDTTNTVLTQINYNGNNIVQDYTGYFETTAFADGRDSYRLIIRIAKSNNVQEEDISKIFSIDNTPPTNPTSCIEHDSSSGECTNNNNPDFTWSGATDIISNNLKYYIYWGIESDGDSALYTMNCSYNPDTLTVNTTYYLRINTQDEAGNEAGWTTLYAYKYFNFSYTDSNEICNSDSILWRNNYYKITGNYSDTLIASCGCDSIYFLYLTVNPSPASFQISGQEHVTENQQETYSVPENSNVTYIWSVQNGDIINFISNDTIEILWHHLGSGYIHVVAENSYGCMSDTTNLEVSIGTTGLNSQSNNSIKIYPNPSKNIIKINYNEDFTLEIFNLLGSKVLISKQKKTDISNLKKGVYFISIKNKENKIIKMDKLIKE